MLKLLLLSQNISFFNAGLTCLQEENIVPPYEKEKVQKLNSLYVDVRQTVP